MLVLLAVTAAWLFPGVLLPPLAHYVDVSEPPRPVDYALVLNGAPDARPFAAAALVKAGLAREVLLTRQQLTLESANVQDGVLPSELELTRRVLAARGVPPAAVRVLPGEIGSTFDEARALAGFLAEHPDATAAVVTHGFHTRRARWAVRRALGDAAERVSFVGIPCDGVDVETWWRSSAGWWVYASEYAKLLYYRVRY